MKDIFSFSRFTKLLKKNLLERPIQMFGLSLMTMGLVLLIYFSCLNFMPFPGIQVITFFLGLVGGGYFLSAAVYGHFGTNAKGASYLTLPASHFEKWLCGIVIVMLLYLPVFLVFYRIMDIGMVELYRNNLDPKTYNYNRLMELAIILKYDTIPVDVMFKIFLNVSGIMLLGSLYFNKMGIVKVLLVICAVLFLTIGINYAIAKAFFQAEISAFPFFTVAVKSDEIFRSVDLPAQALAIVNIFFMYVLPCVLFLLSFIKLKEKEF